jgi:hypothetical protein
MMKALHETPLRPSHSFVIAGTSEVIVIVVRRLRKKVVDRI